MHQISAQLVPLVNLVIKNTLTNAVSGRIRLRGNNRPPAFKVKSFTRKDSLMNKNKHLAQESHFVEILGVS